MTIRVRYHSCFLIIDHYSVASPVDPAEGSTVDRTLRLRNQQEVSQININHILRPLTLNLTAPDAGLSFGPPGYQSYSTYSIKRDRRLPSMAC